ncbi:MAG: hypothetical protein K0Q68_1146 [Moraxellaceae bacterium]|jgi:uncharacterized repeat protein (TIGR01451 family)|nr:hypothetical protein [Moraxellaceae bacterium]
MKLRLSPLAVLLTAALAAPLAVAAPLHTPAGTTITNTATATFKDPGGNSKTVDSNPEDIVVAEILDVTVVNDGGALTVFTPASNQVLAFTVTNTGNGTETYMLTVSDAVGGDDFDPSIVKVYLDDGDGLFDDATDIEFVPGTNDPVLDAEGSIKVFVVSDIEADLTDGDTGDISVTAEALTRQTAPGSETAGTVLAGAGDGGSDAVVGSTLALATATNSYEVSQAEATFTKSSSIDDGLGGTSAVPGAIITYTLFLELNGSGLVTDAMIVDVIPPETDYVAGSLKLDGVTLTDVADVDKGVFTGTQIEVDLGDVTAPADYTVTFEVEIK